MGKLKCPKCKSANIQLLDSNANVKSVSKSSSINVNPLKPLTVLNHKEKVKKKKSFSKGKAVAAVATGGISAFLPGVGLRTKNYSKEYHCNNCGKTWKAK